MGPTMLVGICVFGAVLQPTSRRTTSSRATVFAQLDHELFMAQNSPQAVTQLLIEWSNGNQTALDQLLQLVERDA